jgi:hypothetical protein
MTTLIKIATFIFEDEKPSVLYAMLVKICFINN